MKHIVKLVALLAILMLAVVGCNPDSDSLAEENTEAEGVDVDTDSVETEEVKVEDKGDHLEVTVDVDNQEMPDEWCVAGTTYTYSSEDGSVDANVEGFADYKGATFCKAHATSVIETAQGNINSDTTYYYNKDQSEFWIITTTSGDMMPEPQTSEVHIVDGEIQ